MSALLHLPSSRIAALFTAALVLGGCASFSPDGGLVSVNAITAPALGQEAVAVRTPEQAEAVSLRVKALLRKPLTADRAAHIALLNNRDLQAAYNALGLSEAAMVQASLPPNPTFSLNGSRGRALEIEAPHCGKPFAACDAARARGNRCGALPASTVSSGVGNAADRQRSPPRIFSRRCGARACRLALSGARDGRNRGRACQASWRNRRNEQARSSAQSNLLRRDGRAAGDRAPARRFRARKACAGARLWGDDLDFRYRRNCRRCPRALVRWLHRNRSGEAAGRSADGADRSRCAGEILRPDERDALHQSSRCCGDCQEATRGRRNTRERGFEVEVQVPLFDFGEVKVRQAEEKLFAGGEQAHREGRQLRSEAREAYQAYRASFDIARTIAARYCRYARSSRTKRCCATTRCRSTCSRC